MTQAIGVLQASCERWTFGRFLRGALVPLARLQRAMRNRREAAVLAAYDERSLADIGLTGADVRFAFGEPVWRDPTETLARYAGERRQQRPACGSETPRPDEFRAPATRGSVRYLI